MRCRGADRTSKRPSKQALAQHKSEIHQILVDYGVPLVKCEECTVSGDLPSHGPYAAAEARGADGGGDRKDTRRTDWPPLKKWLAEGANPDDELNDAVVADDVGRVGYLLAHGAHAEVQDGDGYTPLINAIRSGFVEVATYLVEHKADVNLADRSGWTPLMWAAWVDNPALDQHAPRERRQLSMPTDNEGLTPLAIAAQNGKAEAPRSADRARRGRQRAGRQGRVYAADARVHFRLHRARDIADRARRENQRRRIRAALPP